MDTNVLFVAPFALVPHKSLRWHTIHMEYLGGRTKFIISVQSQRNMCDVLALTLVFFLLPHLVEIISHISTY